MVHWSWIITAGVVSWVIGFFQSAYAIGWAERKRKAAEEAKQNG